jgi:redox-sensitive bicupin YhaK (pirin superfamily)
MTKTIHKASSRGNANHGWLNSFHTFSFAGYHDSTRMNFGLLRVLNDDIVAPGMGFGSHPHENMEIISIPLSGALHHRDNTGRNEIIKSGDVQIMSAGSGITHSEMNASTKEQVNFLQLWIFPKKENIQPRYEQKTFKVENRINKFQTVVSPEENADSIWINQDAYLSLADFTNETKISYSRNLKSNGVYFFVLEGSITIVDESLNKRDAIGLENLDTIEIVAAADSKLLVIEVPLI